MSIVAGYTRQSNNEYVEIGTYEMPLLAEEAIAADASDDVLEYWVASFINHDTNKPEILGYVEP